MPLCPFKRFHFDNLFFTDPQPFESILLYQFGDLSCNSGYVVKEHEQLCYEISYIVSGKGTFSTNGERYSVSPGDIYVNIPGEIHTGEANESDPYRFFYFGFLFRTDNNNDPYMFGHIKNMFDGMASPIGRDRLDMQLPFLAALKEFRNATMFSRVMMQAYLYQLIVLTYRNFFSDWDAGCDYAKQQGGTQEIVYNVIHFIDNHMPEMKDLSQLSKALGYSYSYLSHLFAEETGISLRDYYAQKRLQKAIELFRSKAYSITEIAEIMHYRSIHTFSRAFKKALGISPSEYIRVHLESENI